MATTRLKYIQLLVRLSHKMRDLVRSLLARHSFIGLALLSLFLVTSVLPAIAHYPDTLTPPLIGEASHSPPVPSSRILLANQSLVSIAPLQFKPEANSKSRLKPTEIKSLVGFNRLDRLARDFSPWRAWMSGTSQSLADSQLLLDRGKQLYQSGQFFEAANLWQQAAKAYEVSGELLNQALSLNYLSLAYQDLGEWELAQSTIDKSLNLLQNQNNLDRRGVAIFAQALNARGSLQLATGQTEAALETWKAAESAYDRAENEAGKLGSQINQAQALQSLGKYRLSNALLEPLVEQMLLTPDSLLKADGLRSLGIALQTVGNLARSKEILEQSWGISQHLNANADTSATLFSIGNVARDLRQYDVALAYYQQAAEKSPDELGQFQAKLNQLSLLVDIEKPEQAIALVPEIKSNLEKLSPSRASIYAKINLAESLMKLSQKSADLTLNAGREKITNEMAQMLATAVQQARQLRDSYAEASALTQLGKLYEQNEQWKDAKSLTELSLQIANKINATAINSRAAWQLGRILKHQGDNTGAIAAYAEAMAALQSLRSDLVAINSDVQFNFKESVEPVYREFVSLLLQPDASQANLIQARSAIEALQLAELDNFFRDACIETRPVQVDRIDPQAAVIYPIILSDRLEVILSFANAPLRHYAAPLSSQQIEPVLQQLYSSFYLGYSDGDRLRFSEEVYNWLIRPAEADLARNGIKTLVFVLDGFLRSLPMASLYDGQQYLVEKYSIALSPGLQLFPEGLERDRLKVLAVGLTEARGGFSALPGVGVEIKQIASQLDSKILLNQQFTRASFHKQINDTPFRVVHLATHGQFSSNPEETFLLTWDDRIVVKDLDRLLQTRGQGNKNPIELLVLSACQTASGDRKAALGLAGFALRSGARSTLGTLWSVSDQSTADLMTEFYHQLTQANIKISKAEALRQAQLSLLKNPQYNHPYFWAPFVLVGNWL